MPHSTDNSSVFFSPSPTRTTSSTSRRLVFVSILAHVFANFEYLETSWIGEVNTTQSGIEVVLLLLSFAFATLGAMKVSFSSRVPIPILLFVLFGFLAIISSFWSYSLLVSAVKGIFFVITIATVWLWLQILSPYDFFRTFYRCIITVFLCALVAHFLFSQQLSFFAEGLESWRSFRIGIFASHSGKSADLAIFGLFSLLLVGANHSRITATFFVSIVVGALARGKILLLALAMFRLSKSKFLANTLLLVVSLSILIASFGNDIVSSLVTGNNEEFSVWVEDFVEAFWVHLWDGSGRFLVWQNSINEIPETAILGYGFSGERLIISALSDWASDVHNGPLSLIFTAGIPGMGIFLFGWFLIYKGNMKVKSARARNVLISIHIYMFLSFMLSSVNYISFSNIVLFALALLKPSDLDTEC